MKFFSNKDKTADSLKGKLKKKNQISSSSVASQVIIIITSTTSTLNCFTHLCYSCFHYYRI